jgi:hypothetical protein
MKVRRVGVVASSKSSCVEVAVSEQTHLANSNRWNTTAEEQAAFLSRWNEFRTPGGLHIARCKRCGFEEFTFAEAKIDKHDKACAATAAGKE